MIQKVRKNFIAITMTMLTLVLIIPLCALNIFTAALTYNNVNDQLEQLAQTEIYILDPRNNRHNEPPSEENKIVGIVKPAHTTAPATTTTETVTTTVTTAPPTDEPTTGARTTKRPEYQPPTVGTLPPTEPQPPTQGTSQPNATTTTPPMPPGWGDEPWHTEDTQYTRPTRPTRPSWNETRPGYEDDKSQEDDNSGWWNGYYAIRLPNISLSLLSQLISLESKPVVSAAEVTTTTTVTTATAPPPESAERPLLTGKVFDRELPRNENFNHVTASSIEHFFVYLDKDNNVKEVHGTDDYTVEDCTELIASIHKDDKYGGYCGTLQFVRKDYTDGAVMVFSDRDSDMKMLKTLLFVSVGMFILMECMVFVLTKILTKRAMRPMQISIEKQQQFISDAGHELKTPLTVISANADILADEIGDNKWLGYIKGQAERMRILVQEMLDLTKITGSDKHLAQSRFNISSLIENVALPFECQAFEQKKTFHIALDPEVEFFGNTERIRRMVGIFVDNAFKYSNENGTIKIQLKNEGGKNILRIYNTGIGIEKGEEEKIFERFYRSDSSRSKQGGYGLGLAIAKSIADQHGIKIQVQTEPGQWISFNLYL